MKLLDQKQPQEEVKFEAKDLTLAHNFKVATERMIAETALMCLQDAAERKRVEKRGGRVMQSRNEAGQGIG